MRTGCKFESWRTKNDEKDANYAIKFVIEEKEKLLEVTNFFDILKIKSNLYEDIKITDIKGEQTSLKSKLGDLKIMKIFGYEMLFINKQNIKNLLQLKENNRI